MGSGAAPDLMAIAPVPAPLRVHVTGAEANLGTRVLALLAASPGRHRRVGHGV